MTSAAQSASVTACPDFNGRAWTVTRAKRDIGNMVCRVSPPVPCARVAEKQGRYLGIEKGENAFYPPHARDNW